MRTTVDIEDDVLQAAKELARQQQVSAGTVISRLLRILSQPAYPNPQPVPQVAARLQEACGEPSPVFWPDDFSRLGDSVIHWHRVLGHRQITDALLLALAVARGGALRQLRSAYPRGAGARCRA